MRIAGPCSPLLVCVIPPLSAVQSIVLQVAIVVHVVLSAVPSLVLIVAGGSVCGLPWPAKFIAAIVVLFLAPIVAVVHCSVVAHILTVFVVMVCGERRRRGLVLQLGARWSDVVAHVCLHLWCGSVARSAADCGAKDHSPGEIRPGALSRFRLAQSTHGRSNSV